ncbi:Fic family protein [Bacteroides caecimuris]|uniref:Fic family protein n=2 Tax=Bacteroidales TaxID=171549 RepID=UPI00242EAD05|nr:Fic family protein [Bacteroides caecimuris]
MGDFSSANGDIRLVNVTAGVGGRSYMAFNKVPQKLKEFCDTLNALRRKLSSMSMQELYEMSFDAHYNLVTIHPWADGNGRMARLLMNWLQFEFGLIPSRIFSDDKEEYIKALVATRESDDLGIFRRFMTDTMIAHLNRNISSYLESIGEDTPVEQPKKKGKTRDRIIELLRDNPKHTTRTLAEEIGITPKGVERHLAILKSEGILHRIGPDKGGEWQVVEVS